MARKSRKQAVAGLRKEDISWQKAKIYRTALYARISSEERLRNKGYTIDNQTALLRDYISDKEDMELFDVYADDGVSGIRFDRPEFNRMIDDMRRGKIDCIVVKDLSRFGRNYLETGDYLDKIFPLFGVRFIAVTDNFDTLYPNATEEGILVPFKNLINEMYSKDLSRKVGSGFRQRQKKGEYVGGIAPYGYLKDKSDGHKLVVDEEVRKVLESIFSWRAAGMSKSWIARTLNEKEVPCPARYKYLKGLRKKDTSNGGSWTVSTIRSVLANPVYVGDMEQHINHVDFSSGISRHTVPKEERYYVENTHEGIVSRQLFEQVQDIDKKAKERFHNSYGKYDYLGKEENLFKGILLCGDCKKNMNLWRDRSGCRLNPPRVYYKYICNTYQSIKKCVRKRLNKHDVEKAVEEAIRLQITLFIDTKEVLEKLNDSAEARSTRDSYREKINSIKQKMAKTERLAASLYGDFADGLMDEKEYLFAKENYYRQIDEYKFQIKKFEEQQRPYEAGGTKNMEMETLVKKYRDFSSLSVEIVRAFIQRIYIYANGSMEIEYTFGDEISRLADMVEERGKSHAGD